MSAETDRPSPDLRIPDSPGVRKRLAGFYEEIGWTFQAESSMKHGFQVWPREALDSLYYKYDRDLDLELARLFTTSGEGWLRSRFSHGPRLAKLNETGAQLVVPTREKMAAILERGGGVLLSHTVKPLTEVEGQARFTFADPFNYPIDIRTPDVADRGL